MSSTNNNFKCTEDFATSDIVLGFLLSVGIFLSFLPQILVLIFRKNVEGLSVISCWFNFANCMGTFLNSLFLNWFVFQCCSDWMTHWVCFENLLPVVQMTVPFVTTGLIFALYVIYRPKLPPLSAISDAKSKQAQGVFNPPADSESPKEAIPPQSPENSNTPVSTPSSGSGSTTPILKDQKKKDQSSHKGEVSADSFLLKDGNNKIERFFIRMDWYSQPFFWGTLVATVIFFGIGVGICYGYGAKSSELSGYAFAMGIMASVLVFFQWLPQIYTTWIADEIGSLSLVSLCIQVPGALLVCYFQLSQSQSWTTWFPYLATAVQEIVLVVICVYYLIRDRKKRKAEEEEKKRNEENENVNSNESLYYQSEPQQSEYNNDKNINTGRIEVEPNQQPQQQQQKDEKRQSTTELALPKTILTTPIDDDINNNDHDNLEMQNDNNSNSINSNNGNNNNIILESSSSILLDNDIIASNDSHEEIGVKDNLQVEMEPIKTDSDLKEQQATTPNDHSILEQ